MQALHVQKHAVRTPSYVDRSIDVDVVDVAITDAGEARLVLADSALLRAAETSGRAGAELRASSYVAGREPTGMIDKQWPAPGPWAEPREALTKLTAEHLQAKVYPK